MPSLGLRLYRLLHRASALPKAAVEVLGPSDWPMRAQGRVLWLHAPSAQAALRFPPLIRRLHRVEDIAQVLITCPDPLEVAGAVVVAPPSDTPEGVDQFLRHWRPDVGVWAGGQIRPVLVQDAGRAGVPLILVEGQSPGVPGARWWSRLMHGVWRSFSRVLVLDDHAKARFLDAGFLPEQLEVTGPLEEGSYVLPVNEAERAALARSIGTRPVWLAAGVPPAEDDLVAEAHQSALRMAHRLLLIYVPDHAERGPELAQRLREQHGFDVACRALDEELYEETQVYIADSEEYGLWYRLAPMTLAGGTLRGDGPLRHPFEAAAMGSAIIHGLKTGAASGVFDQLMRGGASRLHTLNTDLGETVGDLLAADRCARLAHGAWTISSAGAEASERAIDLITTLTAGETP